MKFQYKNQTSPWIFILTDIEILHLAIKDITFSLDICLIY